MSSKDYFKDVAVEWDEMRQNFFSDALRDKAISLASPASGTLAADIGAGTGFITEGLLKKGVHTIAVDESPEMLEQLKRKFKDYTYIDCRMGESKKLPVSDYSVDYVFANMYLHHVPFPADAIKEMARILKPGGKLIITDLDAHNFSFLKEEHHDRWMGFKRDDVLRWFDNAGLKEVQINCVGENCCAESYENAAKAFISIFIVSGIKKQV